MHISRSLTDSRGYWKVLIVLLWHGGALSVSARCGKKDGLEIRERGSE